MIINIQGIIPLFAGEDGISYVLFVLYIEISYNVMGVRIRGWFFNSFTW